jgi:hypothetical protein
MGRGRGTWWGHWMGRGGHECMHRGRGSHLGRGSYPQHSMPPPNASTGTIRSSPLDLGNPHCPSRSPPPPLWAAAELSFLPLCNSWLIMKILLSTIIISYLAGLLWPCLFVCLFICLVWPQRNPGPAQCRHVLPLSLWGFICAVAGITIWPARWGSYLRGTIGPPHTRAKGCDHVIVRALGWHPKAVLVVLGRSLTLTWLAGICAMLISWRWAIEGLP